MPYIEGVLARDTAAIEPLQDCVWLKAGVRVEVLKDYIDFGAGWHVVQIRVFGNGTSVDGLFGQQWYRGPLIALDPAEARMRPPEGFVVPCQPALSPHPPHGPEWLREIKHDGYRIIARKEGRPGFSFGIISTVKGQNLSRDLPCDLGG